MPPFLARLVFVPTFGWNILLGRVLRQRRWWDQVEPQVFLGARPFRRDVQKLRELGVRGVVNMCEEFRGLPDLYSEHEIEQLWLPTVDFQPPSLEHVVEGVEFMQKFVGQGHRVYVHCKAGRARSATVVLCWLIKYCGLSPELAQRQLLEHRPHTNPLLYNRAVVSEFIAQLASTQTLFDVRKQDDT